MRCISVSLLCLTILAGCDRGGAKVVTPEMVVSVSKPVSREVIDYVDYTGRLNARNSVVIQPRVTGYLISDNKEGRMLFREGDFVKEDQILFKIDPRPYKAQLDAAEAAVEQNKAALKYADLTNLRYKEIAKEKPDAVSPRELDQYQALYQQAQANLNLAEANLAAAKLNLNWTTVRSPIDGQISRYYLTPGNLVNQDVTQLTTVVSLDPMYVYFDMDEPTLLRIKKAIDEGINTPRKESRESITEFSAGTIGMLGSPFSRSLFQAGALLYPGRLGPEAPVLIALTGEEFNPSDRHRQGVINFIDNQVNPGTGSISVRAEFRNPKLAGGSYLFVPGMFVRVRLPIGQAQMELLVIDRAITSEQGLKYVNVLDEKDKVVARRVTVGALQNDGLRVITSGLDKNDRVLVGGLQQVRPGMTVQFESVSMPSLQEGATPTGGEKTKVKMGKKK